MVIDYLVRQSLFRITFLLWLQKTKKILPQVQGDNAHIYDETTKHFIPFLMIDSHGYGPDTTECYTNYMT